MYTILIVENDKNHRLLYEHELRLEGYKVITATDCNSALNKIRKLPLDLIVMDINLPNIDSVDVIGRIISENQNIPIIINTTVVKYKDTLMPWIARAFVIKSSDLSELKNTIREILEAKV